MTDFLSDDFLLTNPTARHLFHDYAETLPIIDYHSHVSAREIYEDKRYHDLAEIWLGGRNEDGTLSGDHYKWRVMRSCGVPEAVVTGNADGRERISAFAHSLELSIGNPVMQWSNLEIRRFFGIREGLHAGNAGQIYDRCSHMLREDPAFSVRNLIKRSKVSFIGTTDDPADSLEWHEKLASERELGFSVCPSYRPDKALHIESGEFVPYIRTLARSVGQGELRSLDELCAALEERLLYFRSLGCRASDHGVTRFPYRPCSYAQADAIYSAALSGKSLSAEEIEQYQTYLLLFLGRRYAQFGIVMEIHYSCLRSPSALGLRELGRDAGFDMIGSTDSICSLAQFLSALESDGGCPKIILFSLNPNENAMLDSMMASFNRNGTCGQIQHGAAWWFNDSERGIREQLRSYASIGVMGTFVGMLTDSRSFLSYPRHEYFRRILCSVLGEYIENGVYPTREDALRKLVENICFRNAVSYFSLEK